LNVLSDECASIDFLPIVFADEIASGAKKEPRTDNLEFCWFSCTTQPITAVYSPLSFGGLFLSVFILLWKRFAYLTISESFLSLLFPDFGTSVCLEKRTFLLFCVSPLLSWGNSNGVRLLDSGHASSSAKQTNAYSTTKATKSSRNVSRSLQ
jgi:hypothetical protein